jgi:hypothetical protein
MSPEPQTEQIEIDERGQIVIKDRAVAEAVAEALRDLVSESEDVTRRGTNNCNCNRGCRPR